MQKRILLVDKDPEFLDALKEKLEAKGYVALAESNGRDALDTVRTDMPDLVIMEVMLEQHDTGFEVAAKLKNDPLFGRIPIFLVSSIAEASGFSFSKEEDGYWMKADEYYEKPIAIDTLVARVEELFAQHQAE